MSNQSVPKTNNLYTQDYHLWLEYTVYLLKKIFRIRVRKFN